MSGTLMIARVMRSDDSVAPIHAQIEGSCRPTVHISARTPTNQHAGAQDLWMQNVGSPAAEHFMCLGALHVFVRRPRAQPF